LHDDGVCVTLTLFTDRLQLRPMLETDVDPVLELASDIAIAETMISVPHPLARDNVAQWATFGAGLPRTACTGISPACAEPTTS
jgi:hypothetical protein